MELRKSICIIPARGGSTRIPRKNTRLFHGRPIIKYSIQAAQQSQLFDTIIVSTDDLQIADIAERCGADFYLRGAAMAMDSVGTQEVARDLLLLSASGGGGYACVLYATAPMMDLHTFIEGRKALEDYDADFVMSVGAMPLRDAGQWYWGKEEAFIERVPLIGSHTIMMPVPENTVCDINTAEDWMRAEEMYGRLYPDHVVGL